ncbi:MAG: hypothetical protein J6V65_03295, partial [Fibrobacterales bacterium]|nr:hypothetical protein [Fibrobacterales bacterium]
MKLGILQSFNRDWRLYAEACEKLGVDHAVIDFVGKDWLKNCLESGCDGFVVRPPNDFPERKA